MDGKKMFSLTASEVAAAVHKSVPHIANHLLKKADTNSGFGDNPQCIHPVTRVVTLSLDANTRLQVEDALCGSAIEKSGGQLSHADARKQLAFALACMQTLTQDGAMQAFEGASDVTGQEVWEMLEGVCGRDGMEFLRFVHNEKSSDSVKEASKHLVRAFV
jgi:hypothetical protein